MDRPVVTRILLVARRDPQDPIGAGLKRAGFAVSRADSSLASARLLESARPDLLIIDEHTLNRRERDDLAAAAARQGIPVLRLSHGPSGASSSAGIDIVVRRVRALLGEPGPEQGSGQAGAPAVEGGNLTVGDLVVDPDEHSARVGATPLDLTVKEFELLCSFAQKPGRIWSRRQLIDQLWGHDYVDPHVVTVHIANLRRKLEKAATAEGAGSGHGSMPRWPDIEAVRGVGYRMVAGPAPEVADRCRVVEKSKGSGRLPFVGRARELEVIRRALAAAMGGEARGVAIVGDPGIGKTRIAEEAAAYARAQGARVYWGRCRDASVKPVYEPWVEILEQWRTEDPASGAASVFQPGSPGDIRPPTDGEGARLALFERLTEVVRDKAERGALCLVFDDLHWADPSTLLALQHVIGRLRHQEVVFLLTYRPCDAAQAPFLTELVASLVRDDAGQVVSLGPLSEHEVRLLLESAGLVLPGSEGGPAPGVESMAEVLQATEGNPFFLTQLIRLRLLEGASAASAAGGQPLSREEGVRRVVLQRLARLSAPCREVLDVACIIGREFAQPLLAGVVELAPESVLERLAEAVDAHMVAIREEAPEEYSFVHSIFRDVLQGELSAQRRAVLHAKVGSVLEALHGDRLDVYAADLAYHFSEAVPAGFVPQAVDHCLRAARVAAAQCAWNEACTQLRRAVDLIGMLPAEAPQKAPAFVGRVWEDLAYDCWAMLDLDLALEAYEQAACRVPPEDRVRRAGLKDRAAYMDILSGRYERATARLDEAEALLGVPAGFTEQLQWDSWLSIQRHRGAVQFYEGRLEGLDELVERVELTAGTHGGPREKGYFQLTRMLAEWSGQRWVSTSKIIDLAEECAKNLRVAGSPEDVLWGENALADALLWSREKWAEARDQAILVLDLSKRFHSVFGELGALWDLEIWHRRRGETEAVREYASMTLDRTTGSKGIPGAYCGEAKGHLSWVALRDGDLERARELAGEALRGIREDAFSPYEWQARWTLLGLAMNDRDWDEVSRQAEAMLDPLQQKLPDEVEQSLRSLVQEHAQRGKAPSAATVEALEETARAHGYL